MYKILLGGAKMSFRSLKGYLFAVLSAVIYGSMPLMAKYIYADGVSPFTLVFLRNLFSLIPLAVLAYREAGSLKLSAKLMPRVALISLFGCSCTPLLLFSSYRFIASGTATVFHFAYPAIVVAAEMLFMKKKARLFNLLSVIVCVAGVSMFYTPGEAFNLTGASLALLSAVTFAVYVILLSHFDSGKVGIFLFSFYVALISSFITLFACLVTNSLSLPSSPSVWALCIVFSLLVTTGAVVLFQKSTFLIGGECASILSTLEPITSVIIGIVAFGEPLGARVVLGTVLVVSASIMCAVFNIVKDKKA